MNTFLRFSFDKRNRIRLIASISLIFLILPSFAQNKLLSYNSNHKFKIVQFTDLHIVYQDSRSTVAFECIKNVIETEKPDLIVITGDIIYSSPADKNFQNVLSYISNFKIPFALTFGNHDREQGLSNAELLNIALKYPYCIASNTPNITGVGNYALTIKSNSGGNNAAILYFIDSNQGSLLKSQGVDGYDFIHFDQINWYRQTSETFTQQNKGVSLPALAFFHIPLPEFAEASVNPDAQLYGIRREKVCFPLLNSGLFAAMKEQADVMGVFVGHDHDNDFAVAWYGILLAYGRFSGGSTEYNHIPNGARIIELTEGERTIHTWIRQTDGEILQDTEFPKDYVKK